MGCIIRECNSCGYADGEYPAHGRKDCPKCGGNLIVSFDEEGMHYPDEYYEHLEYCAEYGLDPEEEEWPGPRRG